MLRIVLKLILCPSKNWSQKLIGIIQRDELTRTDIKSMIKEKKVTIYDENSLIIYKSNHLRDWTRTEAMNDVKEEIGAIYNQLPE